MSVDAPNTAAEQGPEILTPDVFREFMSSYPGGVTIVTTYDHDGAPRGFTCSSMCSVTMEPPTLLLCVNTRSTTLDAVQDCTRFAVNLLHSGGESAARVFSSVQEDRFSKVRWRASTTGGLPILYEDAHAIAECRLTATRNVGTHTVLFGEIDAIILDHQPLHYQGWHRWGRGGFGHRDRRRHFRGRGLHRGRCRSLRGRSPPGLRRGRNVLRRRLDHRWARRPHHRGWLYHRRR
ncbi:flavin reductase family protein, partial [Mycobacterium ulcerans]